jgi:CSLREA domain-containing protein
MFDAKTFETAMIESPMAQPSQTTEFAAPASGKWRIARVFYGVLATMAMLIALCVPAAAGSLAQLTVTTLVDTSDSSPDCTSGQGNTCSLRDAIAAANVDGVATISFNVTGTITLSSALVITSDVTITGPGQNLLTVSGNNQYPVFVFAPGLPSSMHWLISGLTIANGNNFTYGGGISNFATLTVTDCTFTGNYAASGGGAIYGGNGTLTVTGSTFTGNSTAPGTLGGSGGGILGRSTLSVADSTFSGNSAGYGGAINAEAISATVTNSTFTGNSGVHGGAISSNSSLIVTNSTFYENSAQSGGGIDQIGTTLTVTNSILAENAGADCVVNDGDCGLSGASGNVVVDGSTLLPPLGKLLAPLGNYGGTTQTMFPLPGGPAICAGVASLAVAGGNPLTSDQRGWPLNTSCVDAGAVQSNYLTVNNLGDTLNTIDTTSCSDGQANTCTLRDALTQSNMASTAGQADIDFASSLFSSGTPAVATPGTVALTAALPPIGGTLFLMGPGANLLTVSGGGSSTVGSILVISQTASTYIEGLTIANGLASLGSPSGSYGGGILNDGSLTLANCAITNNQSVTGGGGGIYNQNASMTITGCTISGNSVVMGSGAGIYNDISSEMTIVNSTITGNTAVLAGGGILNQGGLTLNGSTVTGNTANIASGGGIDNTGTATIANSIVEGNLSAPGMNVDDCDGCGTQSTYNMINSSTTVAVAPPALGILAYNPSTAPLQTMLPVPGSTAIGAGSKALVPAGITSDERGFPRQLGSIVDLGAAQTNYIGVRFEQAPTDTIVNNIMTPPPSVRVSEINGYNSHPDDVAGIPITLSFSGGSGEISGLLTETTSYSAATGDTVALFSGLSVNTIGTGDTFTITSPAIGSSSIVSNTFNIWSGLTQLGFGTSPATPISSGGNAGSVTVQEEGSDGSTVTSAGDTITLTVTGPNSYAASYTATAVAGVATFDLSSVPLTVSGNYSYAASILGNSSVTPASSSELVIGAAAQVAVLSYPTTTYAGIPGTGTVQVLDVNNNLASQFYGTVTVTTSESATPISVSVISGYGSFTATFASGGASQSITGSYPGFVSIPETGITVSMLPQFVVTTAGDDAGNSLECTDQSLPNATPDSACSLRAAVAAAAPGNITFSPTVFAAATSINLSAVQGTIWIYPLTIITGPTGANGANLVTVNGPGGSAATPFTVFGNLSFGGAEKNPLQISANSSHQLKANALTKVTSNFSLMGATFPSLLSNLNISNGNGGADGNGLDSSGGAGGLNNYGTLIVNNCGFTNNTGTDAGAIYNFDGTLTVNNSTFTGNSSNGGDPYEDGDAGAIFNDSSDGNPFDYSGGGSLTVTNSTFVSNIGVFTGGILNYLQALTVTQSSFIGNTSIGWEGPDGGAINNLATSGVQEDGQDTISASFKSNAQRSSVSAHSAIFPAWNQQLSQSRRNGKASFAANASTLNNIGPEPMIMSTPTVTNSIFNGNGGSFAGGISNVGAMIVTNSAFACNGASPVTFDQNGTASCNGNTASAVPFAGAIGNYGLFFEDQPADMTLSGSTFANNIGAVAGGIGSYETELLISASTFTGNTSTGLVDWPPDAGAIFNLDGLAVVAHSTFGNNNSTSAAGSGAFDSTGLLVLVRDTITGNTGFEGAVYSNEAELVLGNSIVSGNSVTTGTNDPDINASGQFENAGGNVVDAGLAGLAQLGNFGGPVVNVGVTSTPMPTLTMMPLPGGAAICAGSAATAAQMTSEAAEFGNPFLPVTDQRGLANTNTTYPGYTADTPCVDAGSVQTNYALAFTTQPPATVQSGLAFTNANAPQVTLSESGIAAGINSSAAVSVSSPATMNSSSLSLGLGLGTFSGYSVNSASAIPAAALTATVGLNPALQTPLSLTASSNSFGLIVINLPVATLANGQVGVAYSSAITPATGGTGAITYAVTGGALPAGLAMSTGGVITGTPTAAGSFSITVTATDSANAYAAQNYPFSIAAPAIVLTQATTTGVYGTSYSSGVTASGGTGAYAYAVTTGSLPAGLILNAATGVLTGTPTNAAAYNFTITATDSSTGTGAPFTGSEQIKITVGKAPLSVTANNASMTYGGTVPTLTGTLSGIVNSDAITATYATTATSASPAAAYPITATPSGANLANYTVTNNAGVLTVGKAPLSITANNASMTYGGTVPTLTGTLTGIVNSDAITATYATTATSASPVAAYPITATLSGANLANYTVTNNAGVLTVGKAPLSVTASNASMTYGGTVPTLTGTLTGIVNSDAITATYATTATTATPVAAYPITATLAGANLANYTVTNNAGVLTVGKAPLSVTANNASMTYGGTVPTLTGTLAGIVNSDAITATYATTATTASPVATYPITATLAGSALTNYTVTNTAGTLTIGDATQSITLSAGTLAYAAGVPFGTAPLALSANGGASGNPVVFTLISGPATMGGSTLTITGAGTVKIVANQAGSANFTAAPQVAESIVVQQAPPVVSLTASTPTTFLQNTVTLTATVTSTAGVPTGKVSFLDGATPLGTVALTNGTASLPIATLAAGTHSITVDYAGDTNFLSAASSAMPEFVEDFTVSSDATVNDANQTVTPGSTAQFTFVVTPPAGGTFAQDVTLSISGLPAGATYTFSPSVLKAGAGATTVVLSIQLPQTSAMVQPVHGMGRGMMPLALGLLLLPFAGRLRRASKRLQRGLMLLLLIGGSLAGALGVTGCAAGGGFFSQQQKTYTVTVTGTSGALSHSATITFTVE